jgi:hypothetical protein
VAEEGGAMTVLELYRILSDCRCGTRVVLEVHGLRVDDITVRQGINDEIVITNRDAPEVLPDDPNQW